MSLQCANDVIMVLMLARVGDVDEWPEGARRQEDIDVQVLVAPHSLVVVEDLQLSLIIHYLSLKNRPLGDILIIIGLKQMDRDIRIISSIIEGAAALLTW